MSLAYNIIRSGFPKLFCFWISAFYRNSPLFWVNFVMWKLVSTISRAPRHTAILRHWRLKLRQRTVLRNEVNIAYSYEICLYPLLHARHLPTKKSTAETINLYFFIHCLFNNSKFRHEILLTINKYKHENAYNKQIPQSKFIINTSDSFHCVYTYWKIRFDLYQCNCIYKFKTSTKLRTINVIYEWRTPLKKCNTCTKVMTRLYACTSVP